ncbi:MAG: tetratricopeptide repeat protein [Bacteroidetes bacterium]|nr:tetratricopeptide repeat protein [Bacteroidota bacterium]
MKRLLSSYVLVLMFLMGSVNAQEDSLKKALGSAVTDSAQTQILLELSMSRLEDDLAKAEAYAKQALEASTKGNFLEGIASSYRYLGLSQFYQAHYGDAVDSWLKSLAMYDSIGDRTNVARMYSNLGAVYESQSDDVKALEFNLKSQKVAEEIRDTSRLMSALTNIGVIYGKKSQTYDKALQFSFDALKYAKELNNLEMESKISTNIGEIYFNQNKDTLALEYFEKSVKGYEGSENMTSALLNIGKVYASRGDYSSAEKYQKEAFALAEKLDLKRDMATSLLSPEYLFKTR